MSLLVWTAISNLRNCVPWGPSPCLAPNVLQPIPRDGYRCLRPKVREVKEPSQLAVPIPAVHAIAAVVVLAIKKVSMAMKNKSPINFGLVDGMDDLDV